MASASINIRIGTRGSRLALWQAEKVQQELNQQGVHTSIHIIQTYGDQNLQVPLHQLGEQGVFTKALDEALLNDSIDIAVHSTKDIPGQISEEIDLITVLKREDARDVLISTDPLVHFENNSRSFKIGTSSVRRIAFLKHYFPQHEALELRGNLDTRIQKLKDGQYDGLLLAIAGVKRAGFEQFISQKLSLQSFTPAVAQGAVGIVARKKDKNIHQILKNIGHADSFTAITAERSMLKTIQGGCKVPVFGYAWLMGDILYMDAGVASLDGTQIIRVSAETNVFHEENPDQINKDINFDSIRQTVAVNLGKKVAQQLFEKGAKELLQSFQK